MTRAEAKGVSRRKSAGRPARGAGEKATQSEMAYHALKRSILEGSLPAGTQLLELEAAERLNVSRTPVREAMVRLQQEGMVELRPRHGMRVLPASADDMREIYEVLTALEGKAAELAAQKGLSKAQLAPMRGAVEAMDRALEAGALQDWARADERFHAELVALAGNDRLTAMVGQLWDQAHRARMATLKMRPKPVASNREHKAVVEAIYHGDAEAARRIHEDHRRRAGELLVSILQDLSGTQI